MKQLSKNELYNIEGGFSITGSLINAFEKSIRTIFELGKAFGSALRRLISGNLCPIK